ncbi:hypothetical protein TcasGA2_TC011107 [Tribolium castaneum]|uniref:Uncharacterized protein n=1 Tax=Tribolium castaneum TaxID=7070 RepID=D6X494_TRICA|nr:hypothetical protein TcasGA2_TC011107 [Tribolium castaneum]
MYSVLYYHPPSRHVPPPIPHSLNPLAPISNWCSVLRPNRHPPSAPSPWVVVQVGVDLSGVVQSACVVRDQWRGGIAAGRCFIPRHISRACRAAAGGVHVCVVVFTSVNERRECGYHHLFEDDVHVVFLMGSRRWPPRWDLGDDASRPSRNAKCVWGTTVPVTSTLRETPPWPRLLAIMRRDIKESETGIEEVWSQRTTPAMRILFLTGNLRDGRGHKIDADKQIQKKVIQDSQIRILTSK